MSEKDPEVIRIPNRSREVDWRSIPSTRPAKDPAPSGWPRNPTVRPVEGPRDGDGPQKPDLFGRRSPRR